MIAFFRSVHLPRSDHRPARAIRQRRFGGPAVLVPEVVVPPRPGAGEMLIEVSAAAVNPVDTKIREGKFKLFRPKLPATIGRDIAGTVRAIGPAKNRRSPFRRGDEVFGMLDYERGAYAECTLASPREVTRRPRGLPEIEASTLGVAALTAWQGLFDHGRLRRGERILIHGGAGGVGHFAVQFAKLRGAHVIATARARDLDWVKRLGADQVIDYRNQIFENEVGNIDLVFDLIGGDTQQRSWQALKDKGGRLISTLVEPDRAEVRRHRAHGMRMVVAANSRQLAEIARLVARGKVRVHVARVFPLSNARRAHEVLERGHVRGKIVLKVS